MNLMSSAAGKATQRVRIQTAECKFQGSNAQLSILHRRIMLRPEGSCDLIVTQNILQI